MTAVNYLWNPINDNIVEEFDDAGNTIADYTTEPDEFGDVISQFRNGQESFYHSDGQGSTLALTNANGDVTDTYAYSAIGEVTVRTGSTVNPFQYIGQMQYYWHEDTGAYDIRRRSYVTKSGRWLTIDPQPRWPNCHAYIYAASRPTYFIDPTGEILPILIVGPVMGVLAACLLINFRQAMAKYPNNEEMRHCYASCRASRSCGTQFTQLAGIGFEAFTTVIRIREPGATEELINSLWDILHNAAGGYCAGFENALQPLVPCGIGLVTGWLRESCDSCCARTIAIIGGVITATKTGTGLP